MPINAVAVGTPAIIPDLPRFRAVFSEADIEIGFPPFSGVHEGRTYPDSYTEEELAVLGLGTFEKEIHKIEKDDGGT